MAQCLSGSTSIIEAKKVDQTREHVHLLTIITISAMVVVQRPAHVQSSTCVKASMT